MRGKRDAPAARRGMILNGSTGNLRLITIEQLRSARGLLGCSQTELASRAGLSLYQLLCAVPGARHITSSVGGVLVSRHSFHVVPPPALLSPARGEGLWRPSLACGEGVGVSRLIDNHDNPWAARCRGAHWPLFVPEIARGRTASARRVRAMVRLHESRHACPRYRQCHRMGGGGVGL